MHTPEQGVRVARTARVSCTRCTSLFVELSIVSGRTQALHRASLVRTIRRWIQSRLAKTPIHLQASDRVWFAINRQASSTCLNRISPDCSSLYLQRRRKLSDVQTFGLGQWNVRVGRGATSAFVNGISNFSMRSLVPMKIRFPTILERLDICVRSPRVLGN